MYEWKNKFVLNLFEHYKCLILAEKLKQEGSPPSADNTNAVRITV